MTDALTTVSINPNKIVRGSHLHLRFEAEPHRVLSGLILVRAFQCSPKRGLQRAASTLPEREVSSHPPLLPAAAGGTRENCKALDPGRAS